MSTTIKINSTLYQQAKRVASLENRTIAEQIEFWILVGKTSIDNPELPTNFGVENLLASKEPKEIKTPFKFKE